MRRASRAFHSRGREDNGDQAARQRFAAFPETHEVKAEQADALRGDEPYRVAARLYELASPNENREHHNGRQRKR